MKKQKTLESIKSLITKAGDDYKLEVFFPKMTSPMVTYHQEFQEIYKIALQYSEESADIQVNCAQPNKHAALLEKVPLEFRSALLSYAYERGHSGGDSDILIYLSDIVESLKPAIKEFAKNHGISL